MSVPQDGAAFGKWLAGIREAAGMTQQQLAQAAGTTARTLQRWEAGTEKGVEVIRVLTALGVKIDPPPPEQLRAINSVAAETRGLLRELDALLLREREAAEERSESDTQILEEVAELSAENSALLRDQLAAVAQRSPDEDAQDPAKGSL